MNFVILLSIFIGFMGIVCLILDSFVNKPIPDNEKQEIIDFDD